MYGTYGSVKATRGTKHEYLGMIFDFSQKGKVILDMCDYISEMVDDFSIKFTPEETAPTPAADDLFSLGENVRLEPQKAEEFHTFVAKALFATKRARPDIHTAIAVLCTRVQKPNKDDWKKLVRLMKYLNGTREDKLFLSADNLGVIKWHVDASFAVHPDFKSQTGACMTYGTGMPITISRKQRLNTTSSTTGELVAVDDVATPVLWTRLFMEAQGVKITDNIVFQDNQSAMLLEKNGKQSSSKRTRALNIHCFFITDQIEKGNVRVDYCPTDKMRGDFFTKPLQGKKFLDHKADIMGWKCIN